MEARRTWFEEKERSWGSSISSASGVLSIDGESVKKVPDSAIFLLAWAPYAGVAVWDIWLGEEGTDTDAEE